MFFVSSEHSRFSEDVYFSKQSNIYYQMPLNGDHGRQLAAKIMISLLSSVKIMVSILKIAVSSSVKITIGITSSVKILVVSIQSSVKIMVSIELKEDHGKHWA